MASIAFHVCLWLLFWVIHTEKPGPIGGGRTSLETGMLPSREEADTGPAPEEASAPPEVLPLTLPEPPQPPTPENEVAPAPDTRVEFGELPEEDIAPPELGTMPTESAVGRRVAPRVSRPPPAPKEDLKQTISQGTVEDATRRAAEHVRNALGMDKGGPGTALQQLEASEILVVGGEWDQQEKVLTSLGLRYRLLSPTDKSLANGRAFKGPRFVFWNCGWALPPPMIQEVSKRVRAFVSDGGFLFTSDWMLGNLLMQAFPGYAETHSSDAHPGEMLPEMVLDIHPAAGQADHELKEGVFTSGVTGRWWLEKASQDITVKRSEDVTVLIESTPLKELHSRSPTVAFTFAYGKGRVLHLMGHYYQKAGNIAGAIAVQRIALNFVLMGLAANR